MGASLQHPLYVFVCVRVCVPGKKECHTGLNLIFFLKKNTHVHPAQTKNDGSLITSNLILS